MGQYPAAADPGAAGQQVTCFGITDQGRRLHDAAPFLGDGFNGGQHSFGGNEVGDDQADPVAFLDRAIDLSQSGPEWCSRP